uniref:Uncharacterized protein n=1 Tax=Anguilla anguilla TaxID=7936 RepID=A0A0E9SH45_ANGAN
MPLTDLSQVFWGKKDRPGQFF